ncbi:hypothetical protein DNTS_028939, partial [Danionella cerebrum]
IMTNMVKIKRRGNPSSSRSIDEPFQRPVTPGSHKNNLSGGDGAYNVSRRKSEESLVHSHFSSCVPTHTNSRPSTADSIRQTLDSDCWRSSVESGLMVSPERLVPQSTQNTNNSYSYSSQLAGFASLPKIPRTPDSDASSSGRSRQPPLAPQFSNSEPKSSSSRPVSAESPRQPSSHSNRK